MLGANVSRTANHSPGINLLKRAWPVYSSGVINPYALPAIQTLLEVNC